MRRLLGMLLCLALILSAAPAPAKAAGAAGQEIAAPDRAARAADAETSAEAYGTLLTLMAEPAVPGLLRLEHTSLITVTARGDASGTAYLDVVGTAYDGKEYVTRTGVEVREGENVWTAAVCPELLFRTMHVEVRDARGNLWGRCGIPMEEILTADRKIHVGILASDPSPFSDLEEQGYGEYAAPLAVHFLTRDVFSAGETAIDGLDVLILEAEAMEDFGAAREDAVEEWIRCGGLLLLGTGAHGGRAAGLLERLGAGPGETQTVRTGFALLSAADVAYTHGCETEMYFVSLPDSAVLTQEEGRVLAHERRYGGGSVIVYAAGIADVLHFLNDNSDEYQLLLPTGGEWFSGLMQESFAGNTVAEGRQAAFRQAWLVQEAVGGDEEDGYSPLVYFPLFILYILIVGPGVFFLLTWAKRESYIPAAVVLVSLLFFAVVSILVTGGRRTAPSLRYATVLYQRGAVREESSLFSLRVPYTDAYAVELEGSGAAHAVWTEVDGEEKSTSRASVEVLGGETEISVQGGRAYEPRLFRRDRTAEETELLTVSLTRNDAGISGTVSGSRRLEDAYLLCGGGILPLGTVAADRGISVSGVPMRGTLTDVKMRERLGTPEDESRDSLLTYFLVWWQEKGGTSPVIFGWLPEENPFASSEGCDASGTVLYAQEVSFLPGEYAFEEREGARHGKLREGYITEGGWFMGSQSAVIEYAVDPQCAAERLFFPERGDRSLPEVTLELYDFEAEYFRFVREGQELSGDAVRACLDPAGHFRVRYSLEEEPESPVPIPVPVWKGDRLHAED
ncbi:MAG: hypothetical protein IJL66_08610 [Lachnospiraceae bacterium]|nr:hypothetical protein [Lachnospiraceae bacterium]